MSSYKAVAFLSYKGGVGRSLTLANVAFALAEEGKRVGCIDLDLDAPGLNIIFNSGQNPSESLTTASLLASGQILTVDNAILEIHTKGKGAIYLLPAINQGEVVSELEWDKKGKILTVFQQICDRFAKNNQLDIILIDAKAGLGKPSALSAGLVDLIVCVTRIDKQCREGTKWMRRVLQKAHGKLVINSLIIVFTHAGILPLFSWLKKWRLF